MSGNCKPLSSGSPDPYLPYEPPRSDKKVKHSDKKLPVPSQLSEFKSQSEQVSGVAPSSQHHFQKLFSGMWGLVQKVIDSAGQPVVNKQTVQPKASDNQELYVKHCFSTFRENFKELYNNISVRPPL
jgi:hypothetical protein